MGGEGGWKIDFSSTEPETSKDLSGAESESGSSGASPQETDAASALQTSAQTCSSAGGAGATLQSNPSGPYMLIVTGGEGRGAVLSCVAQDTSMPASIQIKINSFISAVSSDPNSDPSGATMSWSMKDGFKIYVSYALAASQPGAWIIDMGDAQYSNGN